MKRTVVAVVVSVLTVGLVAVVLALVYPPTVSLRWMIAYAVCVFAADVGVIVADAGQRHGIGTPGRGAIHV